MDENLVDVIKRHAKSSGKPIKSAIKGMISSVKEASDPVDDFGSRGVHIPKEYKEVDLLYTTPRPPKGRVDIDPTFEPIPPIADRRLVDASAGLPGPAWGTPVAEEPPQEAGNLIDVVRSAYPRFKERMAAVPGQALADLASYERENPLGSAIGMATGGVGAAPVMAGAALAGDMAGARLGTIGGALAKGFDEAKQAGRVFKDLGGAQRFEIADDAARLIGDLPRGPLARKPLKEILSHPELFAQYPELADMNVQELIPMLSNMDKAGEFTGNAIRVKGRDRLPEDVKSTLLHEIQHAIQQKEQLPLSEIEAYAVQDRMNMTPQMRGSSPLIDSIRRFQEMQS